MAGPPPCLHDLQYTRRVTVLTGQEMPVRTGLVTLSATYLFRLAHSVSSLQGADSHSYSDVLGLHCLRFLHLDSEFLVLILVLGLIEIDTNIC